MLHENPSMIDIDVNHWRNLQALLLESAKEKRRIVVIHEDGEILKFVHSEQAEIVRNVDRVDDPHVLAERVYQDNADLVDFVAVFERAAFDRYFGHVQDTWQADEDLDAFVHRTYAMMDDYPDGIVTHPGPARDTLGLQWRLGMGYDEVTSAVERFVVPCSTVVLGILEGPAIWATLVLGFDAQRRVHLITSVDLSEVEAGLQDEALMEAVVAWVNRKFEPCSLALFADLASAQELIASTNKAETSRALASKGRLLTGPMPEAVAKALKPAAV